MIGSYLIEAVIRFTSNAERVESGIYASTMRANIALARQLGYITATETALHKYGLAAETAGRKQLSFMTSLGATATALGAGFIGYGLDQAGKFQLAMASVGATLNANASQLRTLQQLALHTSGITAQSADVTAQEMAVAARGLNTYDRVRTLFPELAKFADVQYFMAQARGQSVNPVESVSSGIQFAHMFQAYTPEKMHDLLEWITRWQTVQPESMDKGLTQAKYFAPLANVLFSGAGDQKFEDIFTLLAVMGQTGFLRGRGGAALGRTFLGAIDAANLTGHAQSKQHQALIDLGILSPSGANTVLNAQGQLDWAELTDKLSKAAERLSPSQYASDLKAGFGLVATQFLDVFNNPDVQKQVGVIRRQMEGLGEDPIGRMFDQLMNNFLPALKLFTTNFVNVMINLFLPLLPTFTAWLKDWGKTLGNISDWLGANPDAAKRIAEIIVGLTGLTGTLTIIGAVRLALIALGPAATIALTPLRFVATALFGIPPAALGASGALGSVGIALRGLAAAGAAFLASPIGSLIVALGGGALLTSGGDQATARKDLIGSYGYKYWLYLKGRHPGTLPYSFDTSQGDLTPGAWSLKNRHMKSGGGFGNVNITVPHIEVKVSGVNDPVAIGKKVGAEVTKEVFAALGLTGRSVVQSGGSRLTGANLPLPLSILPT